MRERLIIVAAISVMVLNLAVAVWTAVRPAQGIPVHSLVSSFTSIISQKDLQIAVLQARLEQAVARIGELEKAKPEK